MSTIAAPGRARLEPLRRRARAKPDVPRARPAVRLVTFSALGLYGSLRWASLVAPSATGRMLVLLAFAAIAGGVLGERAQRGGRSRLLAAAGVVVLLVAGLPVCGVPLALVVHLHLRAIADGIGQGLTALPREIVPYAGVNSWARAVILLGGGILLLDAGVLLAFVPQSLGDARRAAAALPLIALAIVPSMLERPDAAYLQGLLLFVLVAAFVWGERLGRRELLPALAAAGLAGAGGVLLAPGLDIHHPVLNYQAIANAFSPTGTETFDWFQGYGPYNWPTDGKQVLLVKAAHPYYWKTENLDDFDGTGWVEAQQNLSSVGAAPPTAPAPSLAAAATWTQTLRITIGGMYTSDVIASGTAQAPQDVPGGVTPGASSGTWIANQQLGPGDAYVVKVYTPDPTAAELGAAGTSFPADLSYYREIFLPVAGARSIAGTIAFPAFGSSAPTVAGDAYIASTLGASPYAAAYSLAQRLAAGEPTPYAFVERVQQYLQHGYTYNLDAPISAYPLETFLFKDKYGYCQQFAGAMALLLRMGGIPARVAVGFTPGTYSASSGEFTVADTDAHAWVEVWFPTYGWVAFNPTPTATVSSLQKPLGGGSTLPRPAAAGFKDRGGAPTPTTSSRHSGGSGPGVAAIAAIALLLGLGGAAVAWWLHSRAREPASSDELLAELERALRRSSVELTPATTLADLERRFRRSIEAAEYVHAVARGRYADLTEPPTPAQRRALRAKLAEGRGSFGRIRALWALPPRL
jgi:transglutaminase-like putative cysteine protease